MCVTDCDEDGAAAGNCSRAAETQSHVGDSEQSAAAALTVTPDKSTKSSSSV